MKAFSVDIKNNIAYLKFDLQGEKVNKIDLDAGTELQALLSDLKKEKQIKGVILYSGKPNTFIAGADIHLINSITSKVQGEELSQEAQGMADALEFFPIPIVAAIHGVCLGGGLEVALSCDYRVVSDHESTSLGLPETRLGIIPGMGGCVRLPKLIGAREALGIILAGSTVNSKKALRIGLADDVVPHELLLERAEAFLKKVQFKKRKKRVNIKGGLNALLLDKNPLGRALVFKLAKKNVLKETKGKYPAPLAALEVVKNALRTSQAEALKFEAKKFGDMSVTPVCKNLIQIFYVNEAIKKDSGVTSPVKPKDIHRIGVVGAGAMGGGIAQLAAYNDLPVRMKDVKYDALVLGLSSARKVFDKALERRKVDKYAYERKWTLIQPTLHYQGFQRLDFIIEAVVEDLKIKKKVFADLESNVSAETILATNTSSISIDSIAEDLKHPERVVGMHFFNPVHRMPLVEVIRGVKTSDEVVATTVALTKKFSKVPLVVKNSPGFLVNRILMPYLNEAGFLAQEGVSIEAIDQAALSFGMPMGPFTLMDEVGIDIVVKAGHVMKEAFKERAQMSSLVQAIYEAGRYGKKNKKGFYNYNNKMKRAGIAFDVRKHVSPTIREMAAHEIQQRLFYTMVNEACSCLEEEIVKNAQYLDMGMIFGTGFPPFRGGVLKYADVEGVSKIADTLLKWETQSKGRIHVSRLLTQTGKKFYG